LEPFDRFACSEGVGGATRTISTCPVMRGEGMLAA